jgi:membrane protease YdiL (CAAX protease family)
MTSPTEPRTLRLYHGGVAFEPVLASALVAMAAATFYLIGGIVPRAFSLLAGQASLVAWPIAAAFMFKLDHRVLGVRLPRARFVLAAILIGLTAWYLNMRLVMLLQPPLEEMQRLEQYVDTAPLLEGLIMLAVLPPLCEELLFRGVLARSLATRLPIWAAVGLSALLFSAYHLSLVQAPATFTLGLVFAMLAIRADSIVPSVIAHALNNAIAVLVSRDALPGVARWLGENPQPALAICGASTAAGVALLVRA